MFLEQRLNKTLLRGFYYLFFKIMPKWTKLVTVKITFFGTCDASSSSSHHFVRMLGNPYFLNILKSEYSSTRNCSWLLTIYLFLWNLKTVCKSPHKYESLMLISNFFQREIDLSDHLLFHRPSHIRSPIHQSLEIIYGFCLDARENRLCYTNTLLHTKVKWYQLFMINTVNQ